MAQNTTPKFYAAVNNGAPKTFTDADTTTKKTVFTAVANGSALQSVAVTSDDPALAIVDIFLRDGTTDFLVGSVTIPNGAGYGGVAAIDLLTEGGPEAPLLPWVTFDNNGTAALMLPTGWSVKVAMETTLTAAATLTVVPFGRDY
jgi:hypothetical protein